MENKDWSFFRNKFSTLNSILVMTTQNGEDGKGLKLKKDWQTSSKHPQHFHKDSFSWQNSYCLFGLQEMLNLSNQIPVSSFSEL